MINSVFQTVIYFFSLLFLVFSISRIVFNVYFKEKTRFLVELKDSGIIEFYNLIEGEKYEKN